MTTSQIQVLLEFIGDRFDKIERTLGGVDGAGGLVGAMQAHLEEHRVVKATVSSRWWGPMATIRILEHHWQLVVIVVVTIGFLFNNVHIEIGGPVL